MATNIVRAQVDPVHFFSAEMSAKQIAMRLLSEEAGVASERLRSGDLRDDPDAWRRLLAAREKLSKQPLIVDQTGGISIAQLMARARRAKRLNGSGLIVVDYLQLITGSSKRAENRTAVVTDITAGLKALAKELNVPVLALSQLSRAVEERGNKPGNKRPTLADLRDSGSIEQDADLVLFIFRESYYVERARPGEDKPAEQLAWTGEMAKVAGKAEVIVAKYRNGPAPSLRLQFDAQLTRFSDLARSGSADIRR